MSDMNTIQLINQMRDLAERAGGPSGPSSNDGAFQSLFASALGQVNDLTQQADAMKVQYEMGDPDVSLADVMVAGQKATLGFEATVRVRNKVVQAYQDIMNMPV